MDIIMPLSDSTAPQCRLCGSRVYLSGAVTRVEGYAEVFDHFDTLLSRDGYDVVNPVAWVWRTGLTDASYARIMAECLLLLSGCSAVILLPGWEHSKGAGIEASVAKESGIKILKILEVKNGDYKLLDV